MAAETHITPGLTISGTLTAAEDIRVSGRVTGDVRSNAAVVVDAGGIVEASVHAARVLIHGTVVGDIRASESCELAAEGQVQGNITAKALRVRGGGRIAGEVQSGIEVAGFDSREARSTRAPDRSVLGGGQDRRAAWTSSTWSGRDASWRFERSDAPAPRAAEQSSALDEPADRGSRDEARVGASDELRSTDSTPSIEQTQTQELDQSGPSAVASKRDANGEPDRDEARAQDVAPESEGEVVETDLAPVVEEASGPEETVESDSKAQEAV